MFTGVTQSSILGRACQKGVLDINLINIRDYSLDKNNKTDDTPVGGGPGMVMMAQPAFDALKTTSGKVIYMSPRGSLLCREKIEQLSSEEELTILCGHYEGMDQRVLDYWNAEEISVGDYILTGGELPAMVLIDAVARFLPGVLGNEASAADESIYSGLLECDQYTKPRNYQGMEVPEILTNGNHKLIHLWQYENALNITRERRPDLWKAYIESEKNLTKDEKKILEKVAAKEL